MTPLTACIESNRIEQLLAGDLTPAELDTAEEHLTECELCRTVIEEAIGPELWWNEVRRSLEYDEEDLLSTEVSGEHLPQAAHVSKLLTLLGPSDDPGTLGRIGGYEITAILGQGGMGAVFKGFDRSLNRFVAIKMLLPHLATSGAARKRFAREGQAVAAVVDDHVMAIHCVDEWRGVPYLVMTYSRGVSLQKRLNERGPLELREILRVGRQAAKGLAAAHAQGIVHRDVKPANIFLDENVERVQLMDFGLARAVDDASLTRSGTLAGTPQYMSPEQARAEKIDKRSDLFSLGAVLYAMCVGRAPFNAESSYGVLRLIIDTEPRAIREINSDIPEWLCEIIAKLMSKRADERFHSAEEVAELLETCLAHVQQPLDVPLPQILKPVVNERNSLAVAAPADAGRSRSGVYALLAACGMMVLGMLLWQSTNPSEIEGKWVGRDWGLVDIQQTDPGSYQGSFTGPPRRNGDGERRVDASGSFTLSWSRFERRYNGSWKRADGGIGRVSLHLVEGQIRGASQSTRNEQGQRVAPRLAEFIWVRPESERAGDSTVDHQLALPASPLREPALGVPLQEMVNAFNRDHANHPIGKDQSPLTVDEVVTSIRWALRDSSKPPKNDRQQLHNVAEEQVVPDGWQMEVQTEFEPVPGERFRRWSIRLTRVRLDGNGFTHVIRNHMLAQLDEEGNPVPLPNVAGSSEGSPDAMPLTAAIRAFNLSHHTVRGVRQPPLTEEEVVAAIRWWKALRNDAPVTNREFAAFQSIADRRELPPDAQLEVLPRFHFPDDTDLYTWSVRIVMPRGSSGATFAYEIRRQHVASHIDDTTRMISWGAAGEKGLQVGVRVEPRNQNYVAGQVVTPYFSYRNGGNAPLELSLPRLFTDALYEKVMAVDAYEKEFLVGRNKDVVTPSGSILHRLAPGEHVEIQGSPIVLGDVTRVDKETSKRLIPGLTTSVRFMLPHLAGDTEPLSTGELRAVVWKATEMPNDKGSGATGKKGTESGSPTESRLWNIYGVTPSYVSANTATILEYIGLHLRPIKRTSFRGKNVVAKYAGGLDVTFVRTDGGGAGKAGIHEADIVVALQEHPLLELKDLDAAVVTIVRAHEGARDSDEKQEISLSFDVLRNGSTVRVNVPMPAKVVSSAAEDPSRE